MAVVFGPMPTANPPGALVQPPPLPNPLMDAQVAFAVPAPPLSAAAVAAAAAALSNMPPASFCRAPVAFLLLVIDLPPKVKMYCLAT